ncbi:MAG: HNH endonuclease signature motif containing protein [Gemmatimonadota bacterium]|nr:HNH endonuclease signature motif containing protein [Gemmatimonadota bacterium]
MGKRHRKLNRKRWALTRRRVFERDSWRCRKCGRAGRLECDHVRPLETLPDDADPYELDNLQALCRGCHIDKTRRENDQRAAELYPAAAAWKRAVEELM